MKRLKQKIHNLLMSYLFNAVTQDSFLQVVTTKTLQGQKISSIMSGNKMLEKDLVREYKDQAKQIIKTGVWLKVLDSMRWTANERLFKTAAVTEDMLYARAMLYTIDVIEKKFINISNIEN